jgi:carbonic anhydrase/acetyltransferase-like protein (isoleucine patch superfamily)
VDRNQIHAERLIIEDDVWVGNNVVILPGCKFVGRGAVIGAGSIVTKNVNRYAIVAGVPAVPLRMRFPPELCAAIEETNWWLLEPGQIKALLQSYPDLVRYPSVNYIAEATAQGFAWPALTKIRSNR